MEKDICPNTENGNHRYYIYKTFEAYEISTHINISLSKESMPSTLLYTKVEYAISGCNCGAARKVRISYEA